MTGKYHHDFEVSKDFLRHKNQRNKLDFISIKQLCSLKSENESYRIGENIFDAHIQQRNHT